MLGESDPLVSLEIWSGCVDRNAFEGAIGRRKTGYGRLLQVGGCLAAFLFKGAG